jgi:tetratricopeptide (TPR) repeat protein
MRLLFAIVVLCLAPRLYAGTLPGEAQAAVNRQDRAALERLVQSAGEMAARKPDDHQAQYQFALFSSLLSQVATELDDRKTARSVAESALESARKAVALAPDSAEYHRLLGTLCGQVIPGNLVAALKYGKCASEELEKAVKLDPKSAMVWLSRGIGNFYLPAAFGGGAERAIADLKKATELDPRLADAYLWLGIALRKANRNADAKAAIEKSLQLNPERVWARKQLEKTPAQ